MFEQDYVMRLVHEVIRTLIKLIFQKDIDDDEEYIFNEQTKQKYELLKKLVDEGEIEEAENRLMEDLDNEKALNFETALMFYGYLNEKDNEFLETHHFSRKEVIEGIQFVAKHYGYESMADSLLEDIWES